MKRLFLLPAFCLLLSLFAVPAARAQAPAWQSLLTPTQTSGTSTYITATAADGLGNVYLAGTFQGTVRFGSTSLTGPNLGPEGSATFLAKWTPGVGFQWAQQLDNVSVNQMVVAGAAVYITGTYGDPVSFGSVTLTPAGRLDGYVARLTDAGTTSSFTWATRIGGTGNELIRNMTVSGTSLYVVGEFDSPTLTVGASTLTIPGTRNADAFVAKLTDLGTSGALVWAQQAGGTSRDVANAVAVQGTNVYVGGSFSSASAGFGSTTLLNSSTNAGTIPDGFVAKLTDNGATSSNFSWAQPISGALTEDVFDLEVNANGVYATGRFNSPTASIGPISLPNASTSSDLFITKLTDNGSTSTVTWAYRAGGTGYDAGLGLAVNGPGVYVAGRFSGTTADFGGTTLTNASASGTNDIFVTKLLDASNSASFAWAQQAGGLNEEQVTSFIRQGSTLYVGGILFPASSFGSQTIAAPTNTQVGFLAALTDLPLATTPPAWAATWQVYPNPAQRTVMLRLPPIPGSSTMTLTLLDALGRVVYTQPFTIPANGLHQEIDLKSVPPGVYTLRLQADRAQAVRQLIVE